MFWSDWWETQQNLFSQRRNVWVGESERKKTNLYSLSYQPNQIPYLPLEQSVWLSSPASPPYSLTSGLWVRHDSHAKAATRITPKTSAARSCLRERGRDCCCSSALLDHISGNIFCAGGPISHESRNASARPQTCVSRQGGPPQTQEASPGGGGR